VKEYLSLSKNLYITKKKYGKIFYAFSYEGELIYAFKFEEEDDSISFYDIKSSLQFDNDENLKLEAIDIFSQILYFLGEKNKQIYCFIKNIDLSSIGFYKKDECQIKTIESFEKERIEKYDTIDDVYAKPNLVPWNLVPREWDVISLVEKYVKKDEKLLEIGSGLGKNLLALDSIGYNNILGIENSKNACDISYNFKLCKDKNLYGDVTKMIFQDLSFDAVVDIGCLHCVPSEILVDALDEVHRVLKNQGLIISRFFLPKEDIWLKRYPVKVNSFGKTEDEIVNLYSRYFKIKEKKILNGCVYIVGEKI